jgi:3-methyladenine DNA glycosylase AlkD
MNEKEKEILANRVIENIRKDLIANVDEKTRDSAQRYFKETVNFLGVKTGIVKKIGKGHFKEISALDKSIILFVCEELLKSDYNEEAFIALDWSYLIKSRYEPDDFHLFERWVQEYVDNWAKCDTLCNHSVAALVEKYPGCLSNLKEWTKSDNRWMRRAAAVTLVLPARNGKFLDDVFEIANSLLLDKDDLVQKGYGWMLKEASKPHLDEVFAYIMHNKDVMPRTALRYAIEKMPKDLRAEAMKK